MNKFRLILLNEIRSTIMRRSFLLIALGVPVLMSVVSMVIWFANRPQPQIVSSTMPPPMAQVEGYIDLSGIITALPPDIPAGTLMGYADEPAANQALANGVIQAYYVVPPDYVATGRLIYVHPRANLTTSAKTAQVMQWSLLFNLLGGDMKSAAQVWSPMRLTATTLAPAEKAANVPGEGLFMLPYAVVFVFYIVVVMSGSLLRDSLGEEKKNRVQEILLTTAAPEQILTAKIAALGLVGLGQMLLWAVTGFVLLRVMGQSDILPPGASLPASLIGWTVIFFLLGYAVYGSAARRTGRADRAQHTRLVHRRCHYSLAHNHPAHPVGTNCRQP